MAINWILTYRKSQSPWAIPWGQQTITSGVTRLGKLDVTCTFVFTVEGINETTILFLVWHHMCMMYFRYQVVKWTISPICMTFYFFSWKKYKMQLTPNMFLSIFIIIRYLLFNFFIHYPVLNRVKIKKLCRICMTGRLLLESIMA